MCRYTVGVQRWREGGTWKREGYGAIGSRSISYARSEIKRYFFIGGLSDSWLMAGWLFMAGSQP